MVGINYHQPEKDLADKLASALSDEFDIITEKEIAKSPGKFFIDGIDHNSIPDLIIKPKSHLISSGNFIDTIIPVEIKKFTKIDSNKYEDLMFQCHSYRFSIFNNLYPKLCLYFIDSVFEYNDLSNTSPYNYENAKLINSPDYLKKKEVENKVKTETLFGRFGIGEIILNSTGYMFRIKRQVLFEKRDNEIRFKANNLNFWWGNNKNSKKI